MSKSIVILIVVFIIISCSNENEPTQIDSNSVSRIEIDSLREQLGVRTVININAKVLDVKGEEINNSSVKWSSSNENIARISNDGLVFGVSLGKVEFTAKYEGVESTYKTEVKEIKGGGNYKVWSGDAILSGTLSLPQGTGPFPAMVRIHGSGQTPRINGNFLANTILPVGIAVMLYDKRGVGESTGDYFGVSVSNSLEALNLLADDAVAWFEFLANHEDIDTDKLGAIGISQGGWICPIAAYKSPHVKYMINVIGPAITVGQQIYYQNLTKPDQFGRNTSNHSDSTLYTLVNNYNGPSGFNPQPILREINIPGLWVLGNKDYLVPYRNNVEIIQEIINDRNKDYSIITLENAVHSTVDIDTQKPVPWWDTENGGFTWLQAHNFMN